MATHNPTLQPGVWTRGSPFEHKATKVAAPRAAKAILQLQPINANTAQQQSNDPVDTSVNTQPVASNSDNGSNSLSSSWQTVNSNRKGVFRLSSAIHAELVDNAASHSGHSIQQQTQMSSTARKDREQAQSKKSTVPSKKEKVKPRPSQWSIGDLIDQRITQQSQPHIAWADSNDAYITSKKHVGFDNNVNGEKYALDFPSISTAPSSSSSRPGHSILKSSTSSSAANILPSKIKSNKKKNQLTMANPNPVDSRQQYVKRGKERVKPTKTPKLTPYKREILQYRQLRLSQYIRSEILDPLICKVIGIEPVPPPPVVVMDSTDENHAGRMEKFEMISELKRKVKQFQHEQLVQQQVAAKQQRKEEKRLRHEALLQDHDAQKQQKLHEKQMRLHQLVGTPMYQLATTGMYNGYQSEPEEQNPAVADDQKNGVTIVEAESYEDEDEDEDKDEDEDENEEDVQDDAKQMVEHFHSSDNTMTQQSTLAEIETDESTSTSTVKSEDMSHSANGLDAKHNEQEDKKEKEQDEEESEEENEETVFEPAPPMPSTHEFGIFPSSIPPPISSQLPSGRLRALKSLNIPDNFQLTVEEQELIHWYFTADHHGPQPVLTGACRRYCKQMFRKQINDEVFDLLKELKRLQLRALERESNRAALRGTAVKLSLRQRRFVAGLKEVYKCIKAGKMKAVIVAGSIEPLAEDSALEDLLEDIMGLCGELRIPLIFALTRRNLGRALHMQSKCSAVGILDYSAVPDQFKHIWSLTLQAQEEWSMFQEDTLLNPPQPEKAVLLQADMEKMEKRKQEREKEEKEKENAMREAEAQKAAYQAAQRLKKPGGGAKKKKKDISQKDIDVLAPATTFFQAIEEKNQRYKNKWKQQAAAQQQNRGKEDDEDVQLKKAGKGLSNTALKEFVDEVNEGKAETLLYAGSKSKSEKGKDKQGKGKSASSQKSRR